MTEFEELKDKLRDRIQEVMDSIDVRYKISEYAFKRGENYESISITSKDVFLQCFSDIHEIYNEAVLLSESISMEDRMIKGFRKVEFTITYKNNNG